MTQDIEHHRQTLHPARTVVTLGTVKRIRFNPHPCPLPSLAEGVRQLCSLEVALRHLNNHLNLHTGPEWNLRHAKRAAGMFALLTKHLAY